MRVVADTGPIHYLILTGHIDLLPRFFERVSLPDAVQKELSDHRAPAIVQRWIAVAPEWLEVHDTANLTYETRLDEGEAAAIALAESLKADLLLIDERAGYRVAISKGFRATGTLGLLDRAAEQGLVDFAQAIDALRRTTFRCRGSLLTELLSKHRKISSPRAILNS